MKYNPIIRSQELTELCSSVRELVSCEKYEQCLDLIRPAMARFPDAAQPHNLLGIVLEKLGDHCAAMKHFRAAWALDPTYAPSSHNLTNYGTFYSAGFIAFDECDLEKPKKPVCTVEYDAHGIGHVIRRY